VHYVTLDGTRELSFEARQALAGGGWRVATGRQPFRIVCDVGVPDEAADALRDYVLRGGRALLLGGGGPLLARLHLTRLMEPMDPPVSGHAEPCDPLLPAADLEQVHTVTGVGATLLRIGEHCVAIGGPRGEGFIFFLAAPEPPPHLLLGALHWLAEQSAATVRSD